MKKYVYDFITHMFVGNDEKKKTLHKVHAETDGNLYATDGIKLIRIPQRLCLNEYKAVKNYVSAKKVLDKAFARPENKTITLKTQELLRVLSGLNWTKKVFTHCGECPECNGDGKIECPECGHIHDCEECDGTGTVEDCEVSCTLFVLLYKDKYYIKIADCEFDAEHLFPVAVAAQMLGADEIKFTYVSATQATIFEFDEVAAIVMPAIPCTEYDKKIKLK